MTFSLRSRTQYTQQVIRVKRTNRYQHQQLPQLITYIRTNIFCLDKSSNVQRFNMHFHYRNLNNGSNQDSNCILISFIRSHRFLQSRCVNICFYHSINEKIVSVAIKTHFHHGFVEITYKSQ